MGKTVDTQVYTNRSSNKKDLKKVDSLAGFNALTGGKLESNHSVGTIMKINRT